MDACPKKSAAAKARAAKAAGAPAVPEKPPAGEEPKNSVAIPRNPRAV